MHEPSRPQHLPRRRVPARPPRPTHVGARRGLGTLLSAVFLAPMLLMLAAGPAFAGDVGMTAKALLGGNVRPGAWTAIAVDLSNDGPPITGELRLTGKQAGRSTYATVVDLPPGSKKSYTLYAHSPVFSGKIEVALVSGDQQLATSSIPITGHDAYQPIVVVVAERPQNLVPDISAGLSAPSATPPAVLSMTAADLPRRVEAWTAIDRLVWQDVDSAQLDADQLAALSSWISAGGQFVIAGGSTGTTTLTAFPAELLPFKPRGTVDVQPADLATFLGTLPAGATALPAVEGLFERGSVLARSGDGVVAAQNPVGTGSVTLVGFDPAAAWLKGTLAARNLWHRLLPLSANGPVLNPLQIPDDSQIIGALNQLPSVNLPPIDQLFLLFLAYIVLVGPINYLMLRRLDRREWAWVTMPALVVVFAVAAYAMGVGLKGSDVIVNQVAVVRGAQGTDRGLAQVYIGLFSPTRAAYDVSVAGGALLSNPVTQLQQGAIEQPLDVVIGDPSHLRGYQVGFGQLRGFRAETSVETPRIETDLHFDAGRLTGTLINRSTRELQAAALVFGGNVARIGTLAPGGTATVDLPITDVDQFSSSMSDRLYGSQFNVDASSARVLYTRRAVIDQLTGYAQKFGTQSSGLGDAPVLIAWDSHPALDVDVGDAHATRVGETMFMTSLSAKTGGTAVLGSDLIRHTVIDTDAADGADQGPTLMLGRGTMTVEYRPVGIQGAFGVTKLTLRMTQGEAFGGGGDGQATEPLPDAQQPPQDDPLGAGAPAASTDGLPAFQLWDHTSGKWLEFDHLGPLRTFTINHPERYVDGAGSFKVRYVSRGDSTYFTLLPHLEGTVS